MLLKPYNEIVGTLKEIKNKEDRITLVFNIDKEIELPQSAISKEKLHAFIGGRIGILNCDGNYKIRKISDI